MPEQARAFMQGHEQPIGNMGDHYDNRCVEENLVRQAERLPNGPLGIFDHHAVELTTPIPNDLVSLLIDYHDGRVGFTELLQRLEGWRVSARTEGLMHESP